jgi:hypothetical protein
MAGTVRAQSLVLAFTLAGSLVSTCINSYAGTAGAPGRGSLLSSEERESIQEKIVHECAERQFWVSSRGEPNQCAGKKVLAFGFFRADSHVAEPVALDQPFNVLIVIPELRKGYKFARVDRQGIMLDGYLGWLRTDKSQGSGEPTVEQYWDRVRQSFPEFFSGAALEEWQFTADFPKPEEVDFGPLDDWKKRELDKIQAAVADTISSYPPGTEGQQPAANLHSRKDVTVVIGEFSRWSGYVYVVVPELDTLLTIPFALSPLGSEYPVEADSAKRTQLDKASPGLVERIRTHGFQRKITVPQKSSN